MMRKIENRQVEAQRGAWVRPELRKLNSSAAELGTQVVSGDGAFSKS